MVIKEIDPEGVELWRALRRICMMVVLQLSLHPVLIMNVFICHAE